MSIANNAGNTNNTSSKNSKNSKNNTSSAKVGSSYQVNSTTKRAFIGLGSNQASGAGDAAETLRAAAQRIGLLEGVCSVQLSSLYASEPAFFDNQPPFINAVLEIQTTLTAEELLAVLQAVEQEFGRERSFKNAPRTLDCDLIDYEGVVSANPDLTLPHPGILERDFVVTPLLERAPGLVLANGAKVTRERIVYGKVTGTLSGDAKASMPLAGISSKSNSKPSTKTSPEPPKSKLPNNTPQNGKPADAALPSNPTAAPGTLSLCATPIGNLDDITQRVLEALKNANVIYAEDTRVTRKLLARYDIHTRLERCDEHVLESKIPQILERLAAGEHLAYATDAGTPCISDPGSQLVSAIHAAGLKLEVLPGANAALCALVASGFEAQSFYFGGFLPRSASARLSFLAPLASLTNTALIFYEAPHRLKATLKALLEVFPTRQLCLARELTKLHEELLFGTPAGLLALIEERTAKKATLKGEMVLVVDAATSQELAINSETKTATLQEIQARANELLAHKTLRRSQIAKALAQEFNISREEAYALAAGNDELL
ncbi:MAG: 16S rRNA (cytidine(1402)-2'-O)-methyltransferase [Coriobacteriia bacterium]|nr:16S rRNA (cytidine(1402)-2'-O)-methyltransferase [Coriobacteriia bacterium]